MPQRPLNYDTLMQSTRRHFLGTSALGLGAMAMRGIVGEGMAAAQPTGTHFPAKAKRIIYLFQAGGPSQLETYDNKQLLEIPTANLYPTPSATANASRA